MNLLCAYLDKLPSKSYKPARFIEKDKGNDAIVNT